MITKELIERIEGEASLYLKMKDKKVDFATVVFPHFRGMESILEGKNVLDALVLTPRICGICGHAHLMATVRAIEDAYNNAGFGVQISKKAAKIREFTLIMEMIQNHFKWLYMVILPELRKLLGEEDTHKSQLKGAYAASLASKAIALFGGQWPHSSYMVVGGITADPTYIELLQAQNHLEKLVDFFEKETLGIQIESFLSFETCRDFNTFSSDVTEVESKLLKAKMHRMGFAFDQFLILGEHGFSKPMKLKRTRILNVDAKYLTTEEAYTPDVKSYAKNALYNGDYYETGPLGRMMAQGAPLIKNFHRRYKDSAYTRVMARIYELASVLEYARSLLGEIDISEESVVKSVDIKKINAIGEGIVEAPRGPLIHKISIKQGIIKEYSIITPTQFNIGSSTQKKPTPVQKAIQYSSKQEALFIFRTFDVCSVCTTH